MQPLQYIYTDLRLSAVKTLVLHRQPRRQETLTQPPHCDLQVFMQLSRSHYTTNCNHRSHRRLQPLYTEKHKVSRSGFLPNTSPMQRACSHYNAFCSITWLTRMYLPMQMATEHDKNHAAITLRSATRDSRSAENYAHMNNYSIAEHKGGTNRNQVASGTTAAAQAAHTRYSPAVATLHGTIARKNARFRAPASSPKQAPCNSDAAIIQCVLQHHVILRLQPACLDTHMATQRHSNHAAITLRSATRDSRSAENYAHMNNHTLQNTKADSTMK